MKIAKPKYMDELCSKRMAELTKQYKFIYLDCVEKYEKKRRRFFVLGYVFFILVMAVITRPTISPLFPVNSTLSEILLTVLVMLFGTAIMLFLHELIHLAAYPRRWEKKYIIFKYPMIHPFYDGFISKKRSLVGLISPFVIITGVLILLLFSFNIRVSMIVIFFFLNLLQSSQDICVFFCAMKCAPKNSFGYGNAFTTDISKDEYVKLQSR